MALTKKAAKRGTGEQFRIESESPPHRRQPKQPHPKPHPPQKPHLLLRPRPPPQPPLQKPPRKASRPRKSRPRKSRRKSRCQTQRAGQSRSESSGQSGSSRCETGSQSCSRRKNSRESSYRQRPKLLPLPQNRLRKLRQRKLQTNLPPKRLLKPLPKERSNVAQTAEFQRNKNRILLKLCQRIAVFYFQFFAFLTSLSGDKSG